MGLPIDRVALNSISEEYKQVENSIDEAILRLQSGLSVDVAELLHGVKMHEREINRHISRAAKLIDKAYPYEISTEDLGKITAPETAENKALLDSAVFAHFLQQDLETASAMIDECEVLGVRGLALYQELEHCWQITDQLNSGNTELANEWLQRDPTLTNDLKQELDFEIKRANILMEFAQSQDRQLAITRIRESLMPFFDKQKSAIAELPTVIAIWDEPKGNTTYGQDLIQRSIFSLSELIRTTVRRKVDLSPVSPLPKAYFAGSECLRAYPKALKLIKSRNAVWTTTNQLPMEVPLPPDLCFHPVFVCPISKEETSKDNPPVQLMCRHIFAKSSTDELLKYSPRDAKCPYCPVYIDRPEIVEFR